MAKTLTTTNGLKLSTYTPRVRHLKALFVRNLSYRCADVNNLQTFFTLHRDSSSSGFYTSDPLKATLNLSWNSFDLTYLPYYYTSTNHTCLRIWVKDGEMTPHVHLEYDLDLRALVLSDTSPTGAESGLATEKSGSTDVITFGMFNSLFELPPAQSSRRECLYLASTLPPKESYSANLLSRLQIVLRALKQTEQSVERVREDIQRRVTEVQHITEKKEQVELLKVKIDATKTRLDQRKQTLLLKRSRLYSRRSETGKQEKEIDTCQRSIQEDDCHFTDVKSDYYNAREKLLKANALLAKRHKQMIYELNLIYPIEQMVDGRYAIAGVYLPIPEQVTSQNELASSTALGHCAHLIGMLSRFLELPLEYPVEYRGSRSLIHDMARPQSQLPSQKDRSFPLYSRGKDKKLFQYAVHLLNKNIENLRYAYDLHTKDRKLTLRNLKDFLHAKFGIGLMTQSVQETRSPPLPLHLHRTASVPLIRRPSPPIVDRQNSIHEHNWSLTTPTTDLPSTEDSSEEAPATPVNNRPQRVSAPGYQHNSSAHNNDNEQRVPGPPTVLDSCDGMLGPPTELDTSDVVRDVTPLDGLAKTDTSTRTLNGNGIGELNGDLIASVAKVAVTEHVEDRNGDDFGDMGTWDFGDMATSMPFKNDEPEFD